MFNTLSFFRVIKTGLTNFWRNIWLSVAASLVMIITLIILSALLMLFVTTRFSIDNVKERVDISVYFKTGLSENQLLEIRNNLTNNPKIKSIQYVSQDQALENFKARNQNKPEIIESLETLDENPLPPSLQIKANSLDDYPSIANDLNNGTYKDQISTVNFEDNKAIIDRLSQILKFITTFGIGLMIVFALIAVLVIFNTIRLTIYNRREEVEIMRLVGATNWYIRGPFMVEAVLYSITASIVCGILLIPLYVQVLPRINDYLNPGSMLFMQSFIPFYYLLLIQLGISIFLCVFSSLLAIRRYLRI